MVKKIISIFLASACCLSLVACGNKGDVVTIDDLPDYGYFHRYEKTVSLSIGQIVDKPNSYFGDERVGANAVYDLWENVMNVDLSVKFSDDSSGISTKVRNNMYDQDLPDITPCNEMMFSELYDQDMLIDLTPYYEKYASPHTKQILEYNTMDNDFLSGKTDEELAALKQENILASSYKNGKLYAIPMLIDKYSYTPYMYVRTDWLKALAKKDFGDESRYMELMPVTPDEIVALSYRFKREIKSLTGYSSTVYPLYSNNMNYIYEMFGATDSYYDQRSDKSWYYSTTEESMHVALEKVRTLMSDGILDSRINTEPSNAVNVVRNGGCGIYIGYFWQPMMDLLECVQTINGSDWECSLLYDNNRTVISPYSRPNITLYYVVTENCKHPEALILMLNRIIEGAFDPNEAYTKGLTELMDNPKYSEQSGNLWEWAPILMDVPDKNYYSSKEVLELISDDSKTIKDLKIASSKSVYKWIKGYMDNPDPMKNSSCWMYYKIYHDIVPLTKQYDGKINYGGFFGTATVQMLDKAVAISNYQSTAMSKMMAQESTITNEQWNNFVTTLKKTGVQMVIDELDRDYKDTWFKG